MRILKSRELDRPRTRKTRETPQPPSRPPADGSKNWASNPNPLSLSMIAGYRNGFFTQKRHPKHTTHPPNKKLLPGSIRQEFF
jgi:hypothetical protein